MSVNVSNLVQGPATLYIGDFGATEPADAELTSVPASGDWTDLGGTMGGTELSIEQEYKELEVDQVVDIPGSRLVKRTMKVKTQLAEPTLENLTYALNDGTTATGAGFKDYQPDNSTSATQPTYRALIVDGFAPGSDKRRRLIVRKTLSTANVTFAYQKDGQSVFTVEWTAHYVDSSTASFRIIDQTS